MATEENTPTPPEAEQVEEIGSRPLTEEEQYYFEYSYKEPVESIARIEEVAKFLIGATATTSGLFLAAFKLAYGKDTVSDPAWFIPFICWALSIVALVLALFPQRYKIGEREPASLQAAIRQARKHKLGWLSVGAFFFIIGMLSAVYPFAR